MSVPSESGSSRPITPDTEISIEEDNATRLAYLILGVNPYLDMDIVRELVMPLVMDDADDRDFLRVGRRIRTEARISTRYLDVHRKQ